MTVSVAGTGSGTVTSNVSGIYCPSACGASFDSGATITLTAAAVSGSTFAGWSGGTGGASSCSGTGVCSVTLSANSAVAATFNANSSVTADQFVSPNGSDSNDGLAAVTGGGHGPVADVATAQTNIRSSLGTKPLVVMVEDGTLDGAFSPYYGTSLSFTSKDNGTNAALVTYENYPGHSPALSGGQRITGWTDITGQSICNGVSPCYQATLDPAKYNYFEALYYNGARRFRPRLGASAANLLGTYYRVCVQNAGAATSFVYSPADPISASWPNMTVAHPGNLPSGAAAPANDIELFDFEKWTVAVMRLSSVNTTPSGSCGGTITLTGATSGSSDHGYLLNHRYLIENVKSELKYPGQWFLDRSVSPWTLTYLGNAGEDPNNDTVIVPQKAQVLNANGLQWMTFTGLSFEHDDYTVPSSGYPSVQLDPNIHGMALCTNCLNISFTNDTFAHTVGMGLDVQGNSGNIAVSGSVFYDIGAGAARFGTTPNLSATESSVPGAPSSTPGNYNLTFSNNGITGVSRFFPSGDGLTLGLVHNMEIANNTVYDSYHDAMEMCMPAGGACGGGSGSQGLHDIYVHDNDVWGVLQGVTDDGGCYYMMNSLPTGAALGDKIIHNRCHDSTDARTQDSDGYGGHGIYLDNHSGNVDVEQNLVYRVTATLLNMTQGPNVNNQPNTFKDNIAVDALDSAVGVSGCPVSLPLLQFKAIDNIFVSRLTSGFTIQKGGSHYLGPSDPTLQQDFAGNTYYNTKTDWTSGKPFRYDTTWNNGTCSGDTSITWSNWSGKNGGGFIPGTTGNEDAGGQIANPGFVQPYCTLSSAAACVADSTQDNFAFSGAVPPSFNGGQPLNLTFGRTGGPVLPSVAATFVNAPKNPSSSFCLAGQCP